MPSIRFVVRSTIALLAVGFVALFFIVGMTVWLGERAQRIFAEVVNARDTRGVAVELRDALRTAESSQRGYLLTGNEIYLAPYDSAKSLAQRRLDALTAQLDSEQHSTPMLARLKAVLSDKIKEMDETIAMKRERRDGDAFSLFRTNRGKALMDEANVFLYGVILSADERLTAGVNEQRSNAMLLRLGSIVGGIIIVLVVGAVIVTIGRYARETAQARDEVRAVNANLEDRVKRRTADLAVARDRAEVLLAEVNHRVANSLTLAASFVKLQSNAVRDKAVKDALAETQVRIYAISMLHRRLYGTDDARLVALDEYLPSLLGNLETSMHVNGHGASLSFDIENVKVPTDLGIGIGVVLTEWVTNAFKYAYPDHVGEIRVSLRILEDNRAELAVEDDGVGRGPAPTIRGTGLGTRIVNGMATTMKAHVEYPSRPFGTLARFVVPLPAEIA